MPADAELLARSADLKQELIAFAEDEQFSVALAQFRVEPLVESPGDAEPGSEQSADDKSRAEESPDVDSRAINVLDAFILQHQLPDGKTPLEHFVAAHSELSGADRELMLGWRDVVEGIFTVQKRDGDALLVDNLIDELMYRIRSPQGRSAFAQLAGGSFLVARLVPIGDEWLISGAHSIMPWISAGVAYRLAAELAVGNPTLVFRNPANVARAWKMQEEERNDFIAFFGSDVVILTGGELDERMRAYAHYQIYESKDSEGKTVAERASRIYGAIPQPPDPDLPDGITQAESVGVVFDEVDGLKFLPNYRLVVDAFTDPDQLSDERHRDVVRSYFGDRDISPRVLTRLAGADPERASRVVQRVLDRAGFSWADSGEVLLNEMKAAYYAAPVLPGVTPLGEELARARIAGTAKLGPAPKTHAVRQQLRNAGKRRKHK